jgi:dipeptidyl-peptidase 4
MRATIWLFLALVFLAPSLHAQTGNKQITLEDLFKNGTFRMKGVPGFNAMKDGKYYTQIDNENKHQYINIYDLATGSKEHTLFNSATNTFGGTELKLESYAFSEDEQKMLLYTEGQHI